MILNPTINRSVLLVIPKQPFYDWSNALTPDLNPVQPADVNDHNTYLLEDELFLDDFKSELKPYWKKIFIHELFGQWTDERDYPSLSWELFNQWFDCYRSSLVIDLTDQPLYIEEYE